MKTAVQKVKNFFYEKRDYCLVMAIVFVLFNFILLLNGCFPYGKKTVLMGDSLVQVGAFFEHIFAVFEGKSSLFYSNYVGGGVEIFSTIEYMLLNPFYLIVLLFGKNLVFYSFNFAVMLMFIFNATVFFWFAKKYFKNINLITKIALTILFTFSIYITTNFCLVTWLIFPGLLLLLVDKFLKLVESGKMVGFVVVLSWFVVNCFSVGVSSNILLVVLFSAYIFLTVQKEDWGKVFVRLVVAYVLAILAVVAILFPAIIALLGGGRVSSGGLFSGEFNNLTVSKLGAIALEGILFVFAIYHLVKSNKKEGKTKFYIFAIILTTVTILCGGITRLLCGLQYNGFHFRFYFINEVILFLISLEFFNAKYEIKTAEKPCEFKLYKILYFVFLFMAGFCLLWWVILSASKFGIGLKSIVPEKSISTAVAILFAVVLFGLVFSMFAARKGLITKKLAKVFLVFAVVSTMITSVLSVGFYMGSEVQVYQLKKLTQNLDENGKLKIVSGNLYDSSNAVSLGIRNNSYFSSLVSHKTLDSNANMGYYTSKVAVLSHHGNLIYDSLMGYKYVLSYEELNRPYLKLISSNEEMKLYENTLATTAAVFIDESFDYSENLSPSENLVNLQAAMSVEGELFKNLTVSKTEVEEFDEGYAKYITKYSITAETDGIVYINQDIMTLNKDQNKGFTKYFDDLLGENSKYYFVEKLPSDKIKTDLMFVSAGETVEFYICSLDDEAASSDLVSFEFMDYQVAKTVCEKLQANSCELKYTKKGYEVVTNGKVGRLVVMSTDIDNMKYFANNEEVEVGHEIGYFVSVNISENTETFVAKYNNKPAKIWIVVVLIMAGLIAAISTVYKKTRFKFLEKILPMTVFVANCCILLVFVLFGIFLTIFRMWV